MKSKFSPSFRKFNKIVTMVNLSMWQMSSPFSNNLRIAVDICLIGFYWPFTKTLRKIMKK